MSRMVTSPSTVTSVLGTSSVCGRRRRPAPAASTRPIMYRSPACHLALLGPGTSGRAFPPPGGRSVTLPHEMLRPAADTIPRPHPPQRRRRAGMQNDWRQRGRRGLERLAGPQVRARRTRRELAALRERVAVLEDEVRESRRLNRRVAELTDVVQELLLPQAQRDDERLSERLEKYESSSF